MKKQLVMLVVRNFIKEKIEEMQRKLEEEYGEANSYVMDPKKRNLSKQKKKLKI